MDKWKISNIYNDSNKIFVENTNITGDTSLTFLLPYLSVLDLLTEFNGERYLFPHYVVNTDYDIAKVQRGAWASLVSNRERYKRLIAIDEMTYTIDDEYEINKEYGKDVTTRDYDEDVTTFVTGAQTDSVTTAPKGTTTTESATTFDSTTERETGSTQTDTIETIDSATSGERTDTNTRDERSDTTTRDARTDKEYGHKTSPQDYIMKERTLSNSNTLKLIVSETLNFLSYPMF